MIDEAKMAFEILDAIRKLLSLEGKDKVYKIEFWGNSDSEFFVTVNTMDKRVHLLDPEIEHFPSIRKILESLQDKVMTIEVIKRVEEGMKSLYNKYNCAFNSIYEESMIFVVYRK